MIEQPELDLPAQPSATRPSPTRRRASFGGFTRAQIGLGVAVLMLLVWAMWVTRALTAPEPDHIVTARLSALVGDYVEAQRFSGSPPERVQAEMRAFMASLDKELQRRSAGGQVVLVGEAVLTRNVPDITDSLKKAVFAAGVPEPKRLSVEQLQRLQQLQATAPGRAVGIQPSNPVQEPVDPMNPAMALPGAPQGDPSYGPSIPSPAPPGASVSTFGGPGGNDGQ